MLIREYAILSTDVFKSSRSFEKSEVSTESTVYSLNHYLDVQRFKRSDVIIFPSLQIVANLQVSTKIDNKSCKAIILQDANFLDKPGNTVIAIHRFAPLCPYFRTFISASSLKKGDLILIYWKNNLYSYTIQVVKEVNVSDTTYLMPTAQDILTIYTCTYRKDHRLIIIAGKNGD